MGAGTARTSSDALRAASAAGGAVRRRSKPRVVWLPQTNANSIGDGTTVIQGFVLAASGPTGSRDQSEIPLVADVQISPLDPGVISLADIESSGYRLRRIVGKVWVIASQSDLQIDTPLTTIVTVGIMVRRADTATGASLANLADPTGDTFNPQIIDNTGDPWVWRRSWFLGNNNALTNLTVDPLQALTVFVNDFPTTNMQYGSVADGPHIDQKTARIVGPEERLFLDASVTVVNEASNAAADTPLTFGIFTDLRVLGSLRTSSDNRRNANR